MSPKSAKHPPLAPKKSNPEAGALVMPTRRAEEILNLEGFTTEGKRWINRAYDLAEQLHAGVFRMSGEPYISHPLEVATYLIEMGLDWKTICAALMHDVLEDTEYTYAELASRFPDPIADLVDGVTKISSLSFRSSHEEQVENLRKMVLAMARDIRVILIKLADRLHNMRTLKYLPGHKQKKIARSTIEIYAPLAHRLGIYWIKSELEDLAMRYLFPEAYQDLSRRIAAKRADRERHIQESIEYLQAHLEENGIQAEVTGRSKHFWSIFQKMRHQQLTFEEIFDLNALRVICETRTECYEILGIIHSIWKPVPEHFSDYIAMPKPNMYQSIHTKVIGMNGQITEIQVRTRDMHQVAEEGIAAHYRYKEGNRQDNTFQKKLVWLRQMVDWVSDTNDAGELLHDLKHEVFDDKVFCFTPRGDVVELARGSTVLDFAYRIHTDLGHRCLGGKVNQKFVPLRTKLKMGDLVEIQTSKTPHVSADWLNIVTTPRGRSKVRHWLKQHHYDKNLEQGRSMLLKTLSQSGINPNNQEIQETLQKHLDTFQVNTVDDLLAEVGFGTIHTSMVAARFYPEKEKGPPRAARRKKTKKGDSLVLVDGLPGAMTRFGQCCKPQPGDSIIGFVTRGRGISIHQTQCAHIRRRLADYPELGNRLVPVAWDSEETPFRSLGIRVVSNDRTGILRDVSDAISGQDIMISASSSRSDLRKSQAILRFTVLVPDDETLNRLMNTIREINDVLSVTRDSKFR